MALNHLLTEVPSVLHPYQSIVTQVERKHFLQVVLLLTSIIPFTVQPAMIIGS